MDRRQSHALLDDTLAVLRDALAGGATHMAALDLARAHWNAWAEPLVDERRQLRAARLWKLSREGTPGNDLTGSVLDKTALVFSSLEEPWQPECELYFTNYVFPGDANFDGADFSNVAFFNRSRFYGVARFDGVRFGASFCPISFTKFDGATSFRHARFVEQLDFASSQFAAMADFEGVEVTGRSAELTGATFKGPASFAGGLFACQFFAVQTVFMKAVDFSGATFKAGANFLSCEFREPPNFDGARFLDQALFSCARDDIRGEFEGDAIFEVNANSCSVSDICHQSTEGSEQNPET